MPYQVRKKEPGACAFGRVHVTVAALAVALFAQGVNPASAKTSGAPPIRINGSQITIVGLERNNSVFVPVRGFFERLGANVRSAGPSIVATLHGKELARMTVGSRNATVNGSARTLPVAPFMSQGKVMLPLRVISEAAGASVAYTAAPRAVEVSRSSATGVAVGGAAAAGVGAATVARAAAPAAAPVPADVASPAPVADSQTNASGIPWWVWALLALLVLGLIVWALTRRKKEPIITTSSAPRTNSATIKTTGNANNGEPTITTRK